MTLLQGGLKISDHQIKLVDLNFGDQTRKPSNFLSFAG
jgi:hypothetical protein